MNRCEGDERCATCGDVAERATILDRVGPDATVRFEDGGQVTVAVDLTPDAGRGDVVLVHQGVAIAVAIDERPEGRTNA